MRIVISGAPGTGKTSIINKLENKGYIVFPEISREIILKYKNLGQDQLFLIDPIKFSKILLTKRISQFNMSNSLNSKNIFFDRGIPDILAYLNYKKISGEKDFKQASMKFKYDYIFIADPWKDIYKNDKQRYESFEESKIISKYIKKTYSENGYDYIKLPFSSVEDRINFIIKNIS